MPVTTTIKRRSAALNAMPGDTRTHVARAAKKRRTQPGDMNTARALLWRALQAAEGVLLDAADVNDAPTVLKAVHALTQATAAYARVVEAGELEARLSELEAAMQARPNHGAPVRRVAA